MERRVPEQRGIHVIIPFYRNADLLAPLFQSLFSCSAELCELACTIVAVNDSPEDSALAGELERAASQFAGKVPFLVRTNRANLGFIRSVNRAMVEALQASSDVVLLNSDTIVFPGAFREMRRVAQLDSMIGFVSPRSNNATLCTFPHQREYRTLPPRRSYEVFRQLSVHLPAFHYVPTVVGFCLYIKREILDEFGLLDESYGRGYNEENDLIMKANRCGYRAALANHAYVYHVGERSFSASGTPKAELDERNTALLNRRYPEYREHVQAYFSGAHYEAERLLGGLVRNAANKIDVAFDCSHVGVYHNGTFGAAKRILEQAARAWTQDFSIYVVAGREAASFHKLDDVPGVVVVEPTTSRVFGIAYRFGQPCDYDSISRVSKMAPINVYAMLDTIAWDCLYLNHDYLDVLWRTVAQHANGILYISDFTCGQFQKRFSVRPGMPQMTSFLSLDTREYSQTAPHTVETATKGEYLLVVGNAFHHKLVRKTVQALSERLPELKVIAFGLSGECGKNVVGYASGQVPEEELSNIYAGARAVIFPSTYEGFGIPILDSLSRKKVVLVRDSPLNRAIHRELGCTRNLVFYGSTKMLLDIIAAEQIPEWVDDLPAGGHSWAAHANDTHQLLEDALAKFSFEHLLPRLHHFCLLEDIGIRDMPVLGVERNSSMSDAEANDTVSQEATVFPRRREVMRKSKLVSDLERTLADREQRITELLNSVSWRVTGPMRSVGAGLLRLLGKGKQGSPGA